MNDAARNASYSGRGIAGRPGRSCPPVKRLLLIPILLAVALAVAPAAQADDLDWEPCGDRFQCADLKVPLDYSRPWWRKIEIPVIKLPATDPKRRIGTAIGGAGGPGQSGVDLIRNVGPTLFAPLNDRFDLVAFDQRGIGTVDCGEDPDLDPTWAEPHDVDPVLLAHRAREAGRRCLERTPLLLPYVTTGNAARRARAWRRARMDVDARLRLQGRRRIQADPAHDVAGAHAGARPVEVRRGQGAAVGDLVLAQGAGQFASWRWGATRHRLRGTAGPRATFRGARPRGGPAPWTASTAWRARRSASRPCGPASARRSSRCSPAATRWS